MPKLPKNPSLSSSRPLYIGIDPGQSGGLVALQSPPPNGRILYLCEPMPETERDIWEWFTYCGKDCHAMIEKVSSSPQMGVASSFKFGKGYGGLRMALIAAGIPFEEVRPQVWQKALGIVPRKKDEKQSAWKNRLKAFAQQLFPKVEVTIKTADALLIAEFNRRKQTGRL